MSSLSAGDDEPTLAEWTVMAISVAVTLLLFGFLAWQAATVPADGTPTANVTETQSTAAGQVVTVEVSNPAATGLESVTVGVDCANATITFEHLPARASRYGSVVCPADSGAPSASVRAWIEP